MTGSTHHDICMFAFLFFQFPSHDLFCYTFVSERQTLYVVSLAGHFTTRVEPLEVTGFKYRHKFQIFWLLALYIVMPGLAV